MLATWQIVAGTAGLVMSAIAVFVWALIASAKHLEDDSDAASDPAGPVRLAGTSRVHAGPRLHWQRPVALHEVQQDLQARLARRERERSEAQVYRICRVVRDGGKYPAA